MPGVGAVLDGRYRLTRLAGRGGMADVWAAEDTLLGRAVAVKVFRFDTPGSDGQRIETEMRTIAALSHPGIVTVHDAGAVGDVGHSPYLVMELVDGQSLSDRLAAGPMSDADVTALALQLAATLNYLHGRGVVHRDAKPANILLQAPGDDVIDAAPFRARLTDFGLARLLDSARLTEVGMTMGTANYLSPEQALGDLVGPASDVYSLGLVLLECLTGQVAYPGVGVAAATARLHRSPVIPTTVDERWRALLTAMTATTPDERPPAAEVAGTVARFPTARWLAGLDRPESVADVVDNGPPTEYFDALAVDSASFDEHVPAVVESDAAETMVIGAPPEPLTARRMQPWWSRSVVWIGAVAAAIVVVFIVALTSNSGHNGPAAGTTPTGIPSYPAVSGTAGQHLSQLESAVG
jgi:serine/threonine protein kinase